jgi:hypothetical protein
MVKRWENDAVTPERRRSYRQHRRTPQDEGWWPLNDGDDDDNDDEGPENDERIKPNEKYMK